MNSNGDFIEIQGTAEEKPFTPAQLQAMLELATHGCQDLFKVQKEALHKIGLDALLVTP
jgi:ribonuclease PH